MRSRVLHLSHVLRNLRFSKGTAISLVLPATVIPQPHAQVWGPLSHHTSSFSSTEDLLIRVFLSLPRYIGSIELAAAGEYRIYIGSARYAETSRGVPYQHIPRYPSPKNGSKRIELDASLSKHVESHFRGCSQAISFLARSSIISGSRTPDSRGPRRRVCGIGRNQPNQVLSAHGWKFHYPPTPVTPRASPFIWQLSPSAATAVIFSLRHSHRLFASMFHII